jgi:hypothetical protein
MWRRAFLALIAVLPGPRLPAQTPPGAVDQFSFVGGNGPADVRAHAVGPDGSVVIVDPTDGRTWLLDATWRTVRPLTRPGEGPGEVREPIAAWHEGRAIAILGLEGRLVRVRPDGTTLVTQQVLPQQARAGRFNVVPVLPLPNGRLLHLARERLFGRITGEYRTTFGLLIGPPGGRLDTLDFVPGDSIRTDRGVPVPRPYLPSIATLWATNGRVVVLANPVTGELRIRTPGRGPVRSTITSEPRARISVDELASLREAQLAAANTDNDRRVIREYFAGSPSLPVAPRFRALMVDAANRVWVEHWRRSPEGCARWHVVTEVGVMLGEATLPCQGVPIGGDETQVVVLTRDAEDIPRLSRHRFHLRR